MLLPITERWYGSSLYDSCSLPHRGLRNILTFGEKQFSPVASQLQYCCHSHVLMYSVLHVTPPTSCTSSEEKLDMVLFVTCTVIYKL